MSLYRAIVAEFAKIFTVRTWWILLLILMGYIAFISALIAALFGALSDQLIASGGDVPSIAPDRLHLLVYSNATSIGYVFPVLFGALSITTEYRNQTLTPTFLANPRRGQVLSAKIVAGAVLGVVFGIGALAASVGVGGGVLAATGSEPAFWEADTWSLIARSILAMMLWAIVGVGIGTLVRSQTAAIIIVLAFTQFFEPILRTGAFVWEWTAEIGKFLPGAASDALVGASVYTEIGANGAPVAQLEWWAGGLVLLLIAVVSAAIGYATSWRRDVT